MKHRGTGIHCNEQVKDPRVGDTFFDADYGGCVYDGERWVTGIPSDVMGAIIKMQVAAKQIARQAFHAGYRQACNHMQADTFQEPEYHEE